MDVVLVPAAFDVLDHQAGLANLGIAHHADLDDHAGVLGGVLLGGPLVLVGVGPRIALGTRIAAQLRAWSRVRLCHLGVLCGIVVLVARRCVCVGEGVEARVVAVAAMAAAVLVCGVGVGCLRTGLAGVAVAVAAGALLELGQRGDGGGGDGAVVALVRVDDVHGRIHGGIHGGIHGRIYVLRGRLVTFLGRRRRRMFLVDVFHAWHSDTRTRVCFDSGRGRVSLSRGRIRRCEMRAMEGGDCGPAVTWVVQ